MRHKMIHKVIINDPHTCKAGTFLKELGHHISDHDAINSTAILFFPYKEVISLDHCQFTGLWVQ